MTTLNIGTRGSKLALAQTNLVAAALQHAHPGLSIRIEVISTKGDRILDVALSKIGDKGVFVTEIEQALRDGRIDLAIHSAKDLPSVLMNGLVLGAIPQRADARDMLIVAQPRKPRQKATALLEPLGLMKHGAHIGSSSLRRASQLLALRPDVRMGEMRGNVDTRLRKLAEAQHDAIVLAAAGLQRLGLIAHNESNTPQTFASDGATFVAVPLSIDVMLPAAAQGALGIECRADDAPTLALLHPLNHPTTQACVTAERAFLRALEGGCQVPIAAYAIANKGTLRLRGLVASLDGAAMVRGEREGDAAQAEQLGHALAQQLLGDGATAILASLTSNAPPHSITSP
jgi:hydroxymethylbilane synthase